MDWRKWLTIAVVVGVVLWLIKYPGVAANTVNDLLGLIERGFGALMTFFNNVFSGL